VRASGRDNQAIRWVSMEGRREPVDGDQDFHVERRDLDDGGSGCLSYPCVERSVQHQPSLRVQHLCLPEAHRCQPELGPRRQSVQCAALAVRQPTGAEQPPQPHVGVQQSFQRDASNSASSITDASGSAFSSPEPRRTSHAFGAVAPGFAAGVSRATTLPRRLMSTGSPPTSARRISSRHCARNFVTEMSMLKCYMAISELARGCSLGRPNNGVHAMRKRSARVMPGGS
jgi:hypothetical protein